MTAVKESPVLVKLEAAAQRVDEINRLLSDPSVLGQTSEIQRLNKERAELIAQGELYHEFSALLKQIAETEDLREDPHPEVRDLARDELKQLQGRRAELESRAKALLTHKDPRDEKNTFIEVRAGTGGDEAGLFAVELVRMYTRIVEAEKEKQESEIAQQRKSQVGTGERSEKIRTYNFPQNRVTDHRVGLSLHRLDQVLQGDMDEIIEALLAADQTESD